MSCLRELQRLLGALNFANLTTHNGRLHCRRTQMFLRSLRQARPREKRPLPPRVIEDLQWWLTHINYSTKEMRKKKVDHFLTTDAADAGWGAQLDNIVMSGKWNWRQRKWHSNLKEMYAVYAALNHQSAYVRDSHILIQSDNRTLIAYVRNEGGTRSAALLSLTNRLFLLAEQLSVTLSAGYLPGRLNGIADRLSRGRQVPEWHLLTPARKSVFEAWGVPDVDLFASKETAVVPQYATWDSKDGSASFCDAFSREWNYRLGWVFPPPNLIPRVLSHLNSASGTFIVIAPHWEQCFWLSDLESRALTEPLPIKDLRKNLVDRSTGKPPPQVDKLSLKAWKVGGGVIRSNIGMKAN